MRSLAEVAAVFLRLGCTSFGGPIAHLGYLRAELVERRRWLDDARYADLVALCQFLPGPASSQVVFGLGMQRSGLAGALAASLCFTLPSAILMIAFAYGVARVGELAGAGWLHGLELAAVAVVAQAVWGMGRTLCPDRARVTIAVTAAAGLLAWPGALVQLGVIVGGGALGWWLYRRAIVAAPADDDGLGSRRGRLAGALALAVFAALLLALPALAAATDDRAVRELDAFYRSGSLVFGGGHVVLPLLRAEVVPPGWLSDDAFLAGYGAAQALPGPLFTFAAYLGAAMDSGAHAWATGAWCLLAIFLPAWLLVGGALPFWQRLRARGWAQAALAGANAAVVGVLLAALWTPVAREAIVGPRDVAAALCAFAALETWKAPPWAVVIAMAGVGQWLLAG
jgi:chromate transporter